MEAMVAATKEACSRRHNKLFGIGRSRFLLAKTMAHGSSRVAIHGSHWETSRDAQEMVTW